MTFQARGVPLDEPSVGDRAPFTPSGTPVDADADSTMDRIGTFLQGIYGGLAKGAPVVAGAVAGGTTGAAVGAMTGPAAPIAVPLGAGIGALVGGGAGMLAAPAIQEGVSKIPLPSGKPLTFQKIEDVPEGLRPFAVAGETIGSSIPFIVLPFAGAAAGTRFAQGGDAGVGKVGGFVGGFLNKVIESAGRAPRSFLLAETAGAGGSGAAAGIAEEVAPGSAGARFAGEVAGGVLNPQRIFFGAVGAATQVARRAYRAVLPARSSREGLAADAVRNVLETTGEDPAATIEALKSVSEQFPELRGTAGLLARSPGLLALEASLAKRNTKFGQAVKKQTEDAFAALRVMHDSFAGLGDPAALKAAAELRQQYFDTLLATRLQQAQDEALEAAAGISSRPLKERSDLGVQVQGIVEKALSEARFQERELWAAVPRDIPAAAPNIIGRYKAIRAERLPEEKLPPLVEGFVKRVSGADESPELDDLRQVLPDAQSQPPTETPTNSGELLVFRGRMLELAREAAADNRFGDARVFGLLAESALDDLAELGDANIAIDTARAYSRSLHDVFTRTFAGETQEVIREGSLRIPPELVVRRALTEGGEGAALRFRQLETAARFGGEQFAQEMIRAQEQALRMAAAQSIDPATGRLNPRALARFVNENGELLDRFPEVRQQLMKADTAERTLQNVANANAASKKALQRNAAFAQLIGTENTTLAVGRIVRGDNPWRDYGHLSRLAGRSGRAAKEGLRAATVNWALQSATTESGKFSFAKFQKLMTQPMGGAGSLLLAMKRGGLVDEQQAVQFGKLMKLAAGMERAAAARGDFSDVVGAPDMFTDLVLRIGGARLGAASASGSASGATLVAAGAGSRAMRDLFSRIPQSRIADVMMEAAENPPLMRALLARPKGSAERIKLARQMHAYLWQAGLIDNESGGERPPVEPQ